MKRFVPYRSSPAAPLLVFAMFIAEFGRDGLAGNLPIANGSFETPILADGSTQFGVPSGWTGDGTLAVMNPANDFFAGASDSSPGQKPLHGFNAASINFGGKLAYEDVGNVVQPNTIYTLSVLAGQRSGVPFGEGTFSLWAGTNLLGAKVPNPPSGAFVPSSLNYTSPPSGPALGRPLRVELTAPTPGTQAWFDNVRLSAEGLVCTPHKATATAQLFSGIFVGATIVDTGCGYTSAPRVTIQGGGGSGATAIAVLAGDRVAEIRVTNGGCCYTNLPSVVVDSPPRVPKLGIRFSRVMVSLELTLGRRYILESSFDLVTWTPTGPAFTATVETLEGEFDIATTGRYFRVLETP